MASWMEVVVIVSISRFVLVGELLVESCFDGSHFRLVFADGEASEVEGDAPYHGAKDEAYEAEVAVNEVVAYPRSEQSEYQHSASDLEAAEESSKIEF